MTVTKILIPKALEAKYSGRRSYAHFANYVFNELWSFNRDYLLGKGACQRKVHHCRLAFSGKAGTTETRYQSEPVPQRTKIGGKIKLKPMARSFLFVLAAAALLVPPSDGQMRGAVPRGGTGGPAKRVSIHLEGAPSKLRLGGDFRRRPSGGRTHRSFCDV